jgi:hypothetical protein
MSFCGHVCSRVSGSITFLRWAAQQVREIASKAEEIPYFLRRPWILIDLCYRARVKYVIARQKPLLQCVKLSEIISSHPLEGNSFAMKKNAERVGLLIVNKVHFDTCIKSREPFTQELLERLMPSSSPLQAAYSAHFGKFVVFNGNSRILALKAFVAMAYTNENPAIEINTYTVNPRLILACRQIFTSMEKPRMNAATFLSVLRFYELNFRHVKLGFRS